MATIRKFTEIKAWQLGRELACDVYAMTKVGAFAKDFGFRDQIQRAVVSINSNIAEGFERDSNPELVKFLGYAKGSAGEVLSQLVTAHDIGYVNDDAYGRLVQKLELVSVMLARLRARILSSEHNGLRWKPPETSKLETQKLRNPET